MSKKCMGVHHMKMKDLPDILQSQRFVLAQQMRAPQNYRYLEKIHTCEILLGELCVEWPFFGELVLKEKVH